MEKNKAKYCHGMPEATMENKKEICKCGHPEKLHLLQSLTTHRLERISCRMCECEKFELQNKMENKMDEFIEEIDKENAEEDKVLRDLLL